MTKVVISRGIGFSLSKKACEKLIEMGYEEKFWNNPPEYGGYKSKEAAIEEFKKYGYVFHIERHDPRLIQIVEEMGEEANGDDARLKIVEIPNDVEYIVEESDCGPEWIAEEHRTWG